jgi:hypothetical protein
LPAINIENEIYQSKRNCSVTNERDEKAMRQIAIQHANGLIEDLLYGK